MSTIAQGREKHKYKVLMSLNYLLSDTMSHGGRQLYVKDNNYRH